MSEFGNLMRDARTSARMTYRALAEGTGLSVSYLNDIELGRRRAPSKPIVTRIADTIANWTKKRSGPLQDALASAARTEVVNEALSRWENGRED